MGKQLLALTTLEPDRPTIRIDGVAYELLTADDFGIANLAKLQRLQATVNRVMERYDDDSAAEPSDDDVAAMVGALDSFVSLVLPGVPAAVRAKLSDGQKVAILQAFQTAAEERANLLPQTQSPTGAT